MSTLTNRNFIENDSTKRNKQNLLKPCLASQVDQRPGHFVERDLKIGVFHQTILAKTIMKNKQIY